MADVALADLINPAGRRAGRETDLPVYSVTKHAGFVPSLEYFKKQVFSRDVEDYKLVEPGDFAYATIHLDEGSIGIAPERSLISPMYTAFRVDESRVAPGYLIRFLKSPKVLAQYPLIGKGAIHRRKAISLSGLGALTVPLPSLAEQRRIAAMLDQADAIRAKRRQVIAHLDSLTQSIFHDMFGDSDVPRVELGELSAFYSGGTPSKQNPEYWSGSLAWFSAKDLKAADLYDSQDHISERVPFETNLRLLPPGTIALVVRGMILAHTAPISVLRVPATINQDLKALVPRCHINTDFLAAAVRAQSSWLLARVSTAAHGTKRLESAVLGAVQIPKASARAQVKFATRVWAVTAAQASVSQSLALDAQLFAALESRGFRGEL